MSRAVPGSMFLVPGSCSEFGFRFGFMFEFIRSDCARQTANRANRSTGTSNTNVEHGTRNPELQRLDEALASIVALACRHRPRGG